LKKNEGPGKNKRALERPPVQIGNVVGFDEEARLAAATADTAAAFSAAGVPLPQTPLQPLGEPPACRWIGIDSWG
jgi:hypothetical protein